MKWLHRTIAGASLFLWATSALGQAPPPVPALPDTQRLTTYSLNASACACSVGFQLYGDQSDVDNWVTVLLNGVPVLSTDPTFGWSLSSGTGPIATIPRPISDAVLTFNNPQTGTVIIRGAQRPRRLSEFSENRGVAARDLNQVFNTVFGELREAWDRPANLSGISGDCTGTSLGVIVCTKTNGVAFTSVATAQPSGNGSQVLTLTGTLTNGHCISANNGNIIDAGGACVTSGSGVTAGTTGQVAQYPSNGSVVAGISLGAITYTITGGTTARNDAARWTDNGVSASDIGVDCTNVADSTSAIQTWVSAHLNGGHLRFPSGCQFFTSSTITVTDGVNFIFDSASSTGQNPTTTWFWKGTNGGAGCTTSFASCVYVIDFEHTDHPTVENLAFESNGSNCPDGFLKFDGVGGSHIGTSGRILHNAFGNGSCANANFVAVNISPTATTNHENYVVYDDVTFCSNSTHNNIAHDGVTNGTTTLTSASNPFTVGMVGQRIRLSWDNDSNPNNIPIQSPPASRGFFDTTIASFNSSGSVTLAAAVPFTANPVVIVTGQSYGIAYRNGSSQNALQQVFANLQYFACAFGVYVAGGGVQVSQISNGFSDVGVYFDGFIAQNSTVDYYGSEGDYIAFIQGPQSLGPSEFSNGRLSNGSPAGNGFLQLGGKITLRNTLVEFGVQNTNSVLIAPFQNIGVNKLGTITPGSGYVSSTYTNVPLTGRSFNGAGSVSATVVVTGGAVSSVTITNQGVGFPTPGEVLTTPNSNLGGSGSGFSVPIAAAFSPTTLPSANGADAFGTITSINNNWTAGCCNTAITWALLGFDQFARPPVTTVNDIVNDTVANVPGTHNLPCNSSSTSCVLVNDFLGQAQATGIGVRANIGSSIVSSVDQIGFRATADGNQGGSGGSFTGFQSFAPIAMTGGTGILTGFEAKWNGETSFALGGQTAAYGFRVRTPTTVTGGTLPNSYGFECDQQKVTNITTGYCFYNNDPGDLNLFAGPIIAKPTVVGSLPSCVAALQGARMFVTDQATAIAYHGAVTGSGAFKQSVICDGSAWYQD